MTQHSPSRFAAAVAAVAATEPQARARAAEPVVLAGGALQQQGAALIDLAHQRLLAALRQHDNSISPTHARGLRDLLEGPTNQALGIAPGRCAYAMPCGAGKTLGMTVWLSTAWEMGLGISAAVSASQIRALCKIRDGLTQRGVPESAIGLRHSYTGAAAVGYYPDTGDADRPIMLVSHERIRGGRGRELFCTHLGEPRRLLIWDESLLASQADALSWTSVRSGVGAVLDMLDAASPLRAGLALSAAGLLAEVERQRSGCQPQTLTLLADIDPQAARAELQGLRRPDRLQRAAVETVQALIRLAQRPLSVALLGAGASNDGLIHYSPAIDPALKNIAVLDASFAVRTLAQGGGLVDRTTPAMRNCKTYEKVSVRMVRLRTGRSTLAGNKQRQAELVKDTAAAIRAVPAGERALVITFKDVDSQRGEQHPLRMLWDGLAAAGIDLGGDKPERERRIQFLTWGNETSLNEYSDCRYIIMAGVVRRNHLDLSACMAGHRDDHTYRMKRQELQSLELSEIAHCVLQGMSRGACRTSDAAGKAGAMKLTILADVKGLQGALADSLPGIQWHTEDATRTASTAEAIKAHLDTLPAGVLKISSRELKGAVAPTTRPDAYQAALVSALFARRAWKREGRSVCRV